MSKKHKRKFSTVANEKELTENESLVAVSNEENIIADSTTSSSEVERENSSENNEFDVNHSPIDSENEESVDSTENECSENENPADAVVNAESLANDESSNENGEEKNENDSVGLQNEEKKEGVTLDEENESLTESESEEEKARKAEEKARKKEKRIAWVKTHKLFIVLTSIALLLIIGVIVSHFATTAKIAFIHNADDLLKATAESKKSELKFKADVTVDEDITLTGYNLDLDKYTLTVNGDLTVKNEKVKIGKQLFLWSKFENGGKIVVNGRLMLDSKESDIKSEIIADNIVVLAENALITNSVTPKENQFADIWFNRNETADVMGSFASDKGEITINATTTANLRANTLSTIYVYGVLNEISGGERVYLKDNSQTAFVRDCKKLYINDTAIWGGFDGNSVENHYFVQKLSTPELIIERSDTGFEVHISHVDNADAYILNFEGLDEVRVEKSETADYTTYVLPKREPSSYKLSVYAVSNNPDEFNDGEKVNTVVEIFAELDKPKIHSCEKIENENGVSYVLTIGSVENALSYKIEIKGKSIEINATAEDRLTVDLSEFIEGVGAYNIRVTAQARGTNYQDSKVELFSFVNTVTLKMGELKEVESNGKFVYSWDKVEGATAYEIIYGEDNAKVISTETEISFDERTVLFVKPLGKGFYKDGESVGINVPEQEIPSEPETPEIPQEN